MPFYLCRFFERAEQKHLCKLHIKIMLRFKLVENNDKAGKGKSFVFIDIDHRPMTANVGVVIRLDQSRLSENGEFIIHIALNYYEGFIVVKTLLANCAEQSVVKQSRTTLLSD